MRKITDITENINDEIARRKQVGQSLRERLLFEELLSAVSARFINLSADRVDAVRKSMMPW